MPHYRVPGPIGLRIESRPVSTMIQQKQTVSQSVRAAAAASRENATANESITNTKSVTPWADGQIETYVFTELPGAELAKYVDNIAEMASNLDYTRRVVFVNGMGNTGVDHAKSARVLSLIQMCPVIGVYNRKSDLFGDLAQCMRDKFIFQGANPTAIFNHYLGNASPDRRAEAMEAILGQGMLGNLATAALFRLLATGEASSNDIPIFAHSQGNLILSNALQALEVVYGRGRNAGRRVYSFGSPAIVWPDGIKHYVHAFTFDPVSLLDPIPSWSISKVGVPALTKDPFKDGVLVFLQDLNPLTHGFLYYLQEDAAFIINRHRVGTYSMTLNMDESGLADELASFGRNEPRLIRVFRRLDKLHNSDADDVAFEYVAKMRASGRVSILKAMPQLREVLIKVMDEGFTSSSEQEAIDFLKSLN